MRLTLHHHPVTDIQFGSETRLDGTILQVDEENLRQHLQNDSRLSRVDIHLVAPGDNCRFGVVFDTLEPRAKATGTGPDFPGILGPIEVVGQGITHALSGAAVSVLDAGAELAGNKLIEMSGDAGAACPFSALHHVVVVPQFALGIERHLELNALRLASVKAAVYLAQAAFDHAPETSEIFDLEDATHTRLAEREGLPRIAYIGQIHSRQRVAEIDEPIFYGANTDGMVPVMLHPNEWIDGALVTSYSSRGVETYFYQHHPVITELYRWHQQGKITLVGAIATMAGSDNDDRPRNCMLAAQQAKWVLGADGVILTKYGGGAPHADMALTARMCETLGMRTTVQVEDMSRDRRAESSLLFDYDEVDAIVHNGGQSTRWDVPAVERAIAGASKDEAALAAAQELYAVRICGIQNQQGASRLRSFVY